MPAFQTDAPFDISSSCITDGPSRPVLDARQNRRAIQLPHLFAAPWNLYTLQGDVCAVATVTWVRGLALVALLLNSRQGKVAFVLDPACDHSQAVADWRATERLLLRVECDYYASVHQVPVHVDGGVHSALEEDGVRPSLAALVRSVEAYSEIEFALSRLCGKHRVRWAICQTIELDALVGMYAH